MLLTSAHGEMHVYPPKERHTHTFIMLHGRGDFSRSFGPLFMVSNDSSGKPLQYVWPNMKFVFPNAKMRPIDSSSRFQANQWFGIRTLSDTTIDEESQIEGLRESCAFVHEIIKEESKLIPCENIVLGGLSQGCATALYAFLTFEPQGGERLGAVVGMSGWLPFHKRIKAITNPSPPSTPIEGQTDGLGRDSKSSKANIEHAIEALAMLRKIQDLPELTTTTINEPAVFSTPVFLGHGSADDKVIPLHGVTAANVLRSLGIDVTWKEYKDFYHWYKVPDEIDDVAQFLGEVMALHAA